MSLTSDALNLFTSCGAPAFARTGEPLLLRGHENVWCVSEGRVDVFLVRLRDSCPDDALHPLFRVEKGQLLFGLVDSASDEWAMCAVGAPGHQLLRLDRANWVQSLRHDGAALADAAAALNTWTEQVASPLQERPSADATAAPDNLQTCDTELTLRTDSSWDGSWGGLDAFHGRILPCLIARTQSEDRAEALRLHRKISHEAQHLERAMHSLAGVLGPNSHSQQGEQVTTSALVAALQLVGQVAGFAVTTPPPRRDDGDRNAAQYDEIAEVCEASHIRRRRVALKGDWWNSGSGPMLGFLEADQTPVAILPSRGGYVLHDPVGGSVMPLTPALADSLSPFAFSFYRSFGDAKMKLLNLMKFGGQGLLSDYMRVVVMGLSVGLLGMVIPIVTGMLFDTVIPGADRSQLAQLTAALLACAFATTMFEVTRGYSMLRAEGRMDAAIQAGVWDRLLRLPVPFFRDYSAGDLAVRANGINAIRQALSGTTLSSMFSAVFSAFNLILLFYYSVKLALVALALVVVAVLFTLGVNLVALRQERHLSNLSGRLAGMVFQFLGAISKLRATGSETRAFHQWAVQYASQQGYQFKAQMANNAVATFNAVFPVIANIALFSMIAFFLKDEKGFSTGNFLAFNAAFGGLMGAMLAATGAFTSVLKIIPLYESAKPILLGEPEITSSKTHPGQLNGEIEINHLSFSYSADGPQILKDISVQIKPGEFVALVGASGSGKSTLLRLLLGFETPSAGSIYFDRQDMAGLDLGALRRQLGVVLQNGQLLAGDVFTNIIGSAATLTLDHAWEAATQAGLADDIRNMPMGMHTVVSEGGGTLSGGQRQRVLIARAIVNRPRMVIFDEATSALDNRTQAMVSESLEKLNATRIVIAHRLSTIVNADRILVLDSGRLVQSGNYAELMAQPGLFADLAKRQIA
ncbi:MAG: hypothetical protein RJA34_2812 [Pseudomonadota bacterium]|jgi:ATP-binding cassette subfamily C protein